jgi:hypothetical protein
VEAFVTWRATGFRATATTAPGQGNSNSNSNSSSSAQRTIDGAVAGDGSPPATNDDTPIMDLEEEKSGDASSCASHKRPEGQESAAAAAPQVKVEKELFGLPFRKGDILGCGWNRTDNSVFFARDGAVVGSIPLPDSFRLVAEGSEEARGLAIHPLLRIRSKGAELTSNFGQFPFLFDFHAHLRNQLLSLPTPPPIGSSPLLLRSIAAASSSSPRGTLLPPAVVES